MSKSKKRKAPAGMPKATADALGFKKPGKTRVNPVPVRERNPLQYLLHRGSEGQGVILSGEQSLQLAGAFIDQKNWMSEVARQLAEESNENARLVTLWFEGVERCRWPEGDTEAEEAFAAMEAILAPPEDEDA